MCEDHLDVEPVCLIKSLGKVKFEDDTFEIFVFDRVQHLLSDAYCFMDLAMMKKGKLFRWNVLRENGLDAISDDFGYDLIDVVA